MALYVYVGKDAAAGAALRPAVRPKHLEHLAPLARAGRVRFAGPLLGEDGAPRGSVIVFEADGWDDARAVAEGDPYLVEGVFESVEVSETRQVLPE